MKKSFTLGRCRIKRTAARAIPYYRAHIVPRLQGGSWALVSAHGNSLRISIMHLEQMPANQIVASSLPTGTPHIRRLDPAVWTNEKRVLSGDAHVG
jgi:2,3-bisphosphoglycerate-dependent phosphoglycerate mutase